MNPLHRSIRPFFAIAGLLTLLSMPQSLRAVGYAVTVFTDSASGGLAGTGAGTAGDLRYQILAANAAGGARTITFSCGAPPCTITLGGPLPPITSDLTIDGGTLGNIIIDGAGAYRVFFADTGTVALMNLRIQNALAQGGAGGNGAGGGGGGAGVGAGLFIQNASVTLTNVRFVNCSAIGGAGGIPVVGASGGGGGGLAFRGGNSPSTGIDAAHGGTGGGAGGGGVLANGADTGASTVGGAGGAGGGGGGGGTSGAPAAGGAGYAGNAGGSNGNVGTGGAGGVGGAGGFGGGGGGGNNGAMGGDGGFGAGGGGSALFVLAGSGGPGGGGGGNPNGGSRSGGQLGSGVVGGDGGTIGTGGGGGGAAAGPAVFVTTGSLTTSNASATGSSATAGSGGALGSGFPGTANSTSAFNYLGTINGSPANGPNSALDGPSVTVASSSNPNLAGQAVTITATVTQGGHPVTSGSVTFTENGSAVAGASSGGAVSLNAQGHASITVTTGTAVNTLHEGDHTIQAALNLNEATGTVIQRVDNVATVTGTNPVTYCNPGAITIPGGPGTTGPAFPNPSNIIISGLTAPIASVTLTLKTFHHPSPVNLLSLLVGPGGANANTLDFLSATGGTTTAGPFDLVLADSADNLVPLGDGLPGSGGPWKPTSLDFSSKSPGWRGKGQITSGIGLLRRREKGQQCVVRRAMAHPRVSRHAPLALPVGLTRSATNVPSAPEWS